MLSWYSMLRASPSASAPRPRASLSLAHNSCTDVTPCRDSSAIFGWRPRLLQSDDRKKTFVSSGSAVEAAQRPPVPLRGTLPGRLARWRRGLASSSSLLARSNRLGVTGSSSHLVVTGSSSSSSSSLGSSRHSDQRAVDLWHESSRLRAVSCFWQRRQQLAMVSARSNGTASIKPMPIAKVSAGDDGGLTAAPPPASHPREGSAGPGGGVSIAPSARARNWC
eukprot:scaffold44404_cov63-Phaeocystis_antarctica.AAC.2